VSKFAVHRFLLESCIKSFADEAITASSEIEQMLLTGFDTEKKEYKEGNIVEMIAKRIQALKNPKEKARMAMMAMATLELSASDRKLITDLLPSDVVMSISNLKNFGLSLQSAGKSKKRISRLYMNSLQSRIQDIRKVFNYAIPKLADLLYAAGTNSLDAEGFEFIAGSPAPVEDINSPVKSLRKKQGVVKVKRKVIVFVIGGVTYAEMRVAKDFPDLHVVVGGTKVVSPLEFVDEVMGMVQNVDEVDIDPRDINLDFR
jgi:hypothetical protein